MLPTLVPNHTLSAALYKFGHNYWAARVRWATLHYAVESNYFQTVAAQDAANYLACLAKYKMEGV